VLSVTIAPLPRYKQRKNTLIQSEDDIVTRRLSKFPIPRPQINSEVLVQFFGWYHVPEEERDADEEEDHSVYREALDADSAVRALSGLLSLSDKCSDS